MYIHDYASPLGKIILHSDGESLTGLFFSDDSTGEYKALPVFDDAERWLDVYFSEKSPEFTPKLKITGTEFQKSVCEIMLKIPFGHVMTYSEIAGIIAKSRNIPNMSARAVGGAAARNQISIIIPCHRVIGTNGKLTGYGGGIDRKKKLLMLEGVDISKIRA